MPRLTSEELNARNRRSMAIAAALVVFIVLVFGVTILKLAHNRDAAASAAASVVAAEQSAGQVR